MSGETMKKKFSFFLCGTAWIFLARAGWAEESVKYIQLEKARLLEKPSAFSRTVALLPYRTAVQVLATRGAYCQVRAGKRRGFIAEYSLNTKKPNYAASISGNYATSEEVAMATKGFNAQVEAEYRTQNPNLPYDLLDRLEAATRVADPQAEFQSFRQAGKLGEYQSDGERP